LWSFSNHYTKGKYVSDGKFDPEAVSQQVGSALVLKRLVDRGAVVL
jgi:lysozyme family protein